MRSSRCIFLLFLLCFGCLEPYTPPISYAGSNALVIDGYVDANGNAFVKLSRTLPIDSYANFPVEAGAAVTIQSSTGENFTLTESKPGEYAAANLPIVNQTTNYKLHIKTSANLEYESDDVQVHSTPVVGRVYFQTSATGESIEVKTDSRDTDPNATGYYGYESIETYEYHSSYFSRYKRIDGVPHLRVRGEFVDTCWRDERIPIVLASTKKLSTNLIFGKVISILPKQSPKISMRYSILVKLRAMSEHEYNYRAQLAKTNNGQNSIFAEIPGAVLGNVHSVTNPDEFVFGYFWGQEVEQHRFFIENSELPFEFQAEPPLGQGCDLETTCPVNAPVEGPSQCIDVVLLSDTKILISSFEFQNFVVYTFTPNECGDCRIKGGTTQRPWYW
ncbi:MAG: DUF4249 domain-containing protein [Bacteroidota bacterium]